MPSSIDILEGLARIANGAFGYAVAWHLVVPAVLVAVMGGWHPSKRLAAFLLGAPVASASVFAWLYGNPFNGTVLAIVSVAMVSSAWRSSDQPIAKASGWSPLVGLALVAFAWVYPHFLEDRSALAYLYGAPMGLIPCPSLALSIGLCLLAESPGGRRQASILAVAGGFYALYGALRLGVWIDLVLIVGAGALVARNITDARNRVPLPAR
jgi:hypothetical protein